MLFAAGSGPTIAMAIDSTNYFILYVEFAIDRVGQQQNTVIFHNSSLVGKTQSAVASNSLKQERLMKAPKAENRGRN